MIEYGNVVQMYCPNCGHRLVGYINIKGLARFSCDKCGCCLTSKRKKEDLALVTVSKK